MATESTSVIEDTTVLLPASRIIFSDTINYRLCPIQIGSGASAVSVPRDLAQLSDSKIRPILADCRQGDRQRPSNKR